MNIVRRETGVSTLSVISFLFGLQHHGLWSGKAVANLRPCCIAGSSKAVSEMPVQLDYSCIYTGPTSHLVRNDKSSMHSILLRIHISNNLIRRGPLL